LGVLFRIAAIGIAVIAALSAIACGGDARDDDEASPPAIRTALAQGNSLVLDADDVGRGWEALPPDNATPSNSTGTEAILDGAFKSWAGCVGNILAGGFIGLGRSAAASSPRFSDGSGRIVASAVAIFTSPDRADQTAEMLRISGEECAVLSSDFRVQLGDVPAAPPDAAASYRMTATFETRTGSVTDTFDLVVLRNDLAILSLVFKSFGEDESGQADIISAAAAKLNGT
jgi:hypothetical protein